MESDPFTASALQWLALWDPQPLRRRWLADMSRVMDRTLRSQAFLVMSRFNLRAMTRTAGVVFPFLRR